MHWVADAAGLASSGSVFPGYPDHVNEAERRAWRVAAARQWQRLLEMRALELASGGRSSPRSRLRPLRARTGQASTSRSSGT